MSKPSIRVKDRRHQNPWGWKTLAREVTSCQAFPHLTLCLFCLFYSVHLCDKFIVEEIDLFPLVILSKGTSMCVRECGPHKCL